MSYDVYVNETFVSELAHGSQWKQFVDWADEIDEDVYPKIWKLSEYLYVSHPSNLRSELQAAKKAGIVPAELTKIVSRLISASKKLGKEKDEDSILFVTDGVNGMVNDVVKLDDPNYADPGSDAEPDADDDSNE